MAQNNIKYAPTVNAFTTTLNGAISSSSTTITLNSVTGLQNKAGILVIDRVDSSGNLTPSKQEWIYFTGVSGSSVTLPDVPNGRGVAGSTAQSHADGAIVEAVMDVSHWNGLTTSYTVQHLDAGTHTSFTTDILGVGSTASLAASLYTNTLNVASTASVGGQLNTPLLNVASGATAYRSTIVNQLLVPIGVSGASTSGALANDTVLSNLLIGNASGSNYMGYGSWSTWTPTFSALTGGTVDAAKFIQIGKIVAFYLKYTLAGAGVSGNVKITPPVNFSANVPDLTPVGEAWLNDTGTASYRGTCYKDTGTQNIVVITHNVAGTYPVATALSSSVPHTWANTDFIIAQGVYEAI